MSETRERDENTLGILAFHNSSRSDASRLVDGVVLQRSGRVALRASGVLRKKSYSDSCAKVRKSAQATRTRHLRRRQPPASAAVPTQGASGQALTTELAVIGSEEVIDRGSKATAWPGLASFTRRGGIAGGHGRDLVPPVPAHGNWGLRSRARRVRRRNTLSRAANTLAATPAALTPFAARTTGGRARRPGPLRTAAADCS